MASNYSEVVGAAGRRYLFKEMIQERPHVGRVWLATSGHKRFLLKDIPNEIYSGFSEDILPRLHKSPYVRLPLDTIPGQHILVYEYLDDDFLNLVRKQIPMQARRQILKASLQGLAELHDKDIAHLDIKPDNIMVNSHHFDQSMEVERVQVIDLENAAYLPKGRCIKGMLAGNDDWRSPEVHFKGELNKPTDIFSFAAVCIYAVLGRVIFGPDDDFQKHESQGALPHLIRLQRQISYFGNKDGFNGLMKYVGDEEINCQVLQMLWEERAEDYISYKPFSEWPNVEDEFKDVIRGMANLDPSQRITARQALAQPWFRDLEVV